MCVYLVCVCGACVTCVCLVCVCVFAPPPISHFSLLLHSLSSGCFLTSVLPPSAVLQASVFSSPFAAAPHPSAPRVALRLPPHLHAPRRPPLLPAPSGPASPTAAVTAFRPHKALGSRPPCRPPLLSGPWGSVCPPPPPRAVVLSIALRFPCAFGLSLALR